MTTLHICDACIHAKESDLRKGRCWECSEHERPNFRPNLFTYGNKLKGVHHHENPTPKAEVTR